MTFATLQTEILEDLNLTSTTATTRVGRKINMRYREIVSDLGIDISKRSTTTVSPTASSALITVSNFNKVTRIVETANSSTPLDEKTWDEIRENSQPSSDDASAWSTKIFTGTSVILEFDVTFASTAPVFRVDGFAITADLSGSDVPAFSQDYHDIIYWGVLAHEFIKMEKPALAKHAEQKFTERKSALRLMLAKSLYNTTRNQNGNDR